MKRIFVMTHGDFGKHLILSAEMIIGKMRNVHSFSLTEEEGMIELIDKVKTSIKDEDIDILILVDLFGGTPFHVASYLVKTMKATMVTGLSLPILLEAYMTFIQGEEFDIKNLVGTGKDAIKNISKDLIIERREK